jgi:hypothetical protein
VHQVLPRVRRGHPAGFRGALPHLSKRGGRHTDAGVQLAEHCPAPALTPVALGLGGWVLHHLPPDLIGQVEGLCRVAEVALIGEDVRRRGDVHDHRRRALVWPEVLGRHAVQRAPELGRGAVHVARREADARLHERQLGMHRRGVAESGDLAQGCVVIARCEVRVHHRPVRAQRGRLAGDPAPGRRKTGGAGAANRALERGAVHQGLAVPPEGEDEGVLRHQRVARLHLRCHAEHVLHVIVRERVVRIEVEGAPEGADRVGEGRGLVRPRGVVEPGLAQSVPGVGVATVAVDEPLVEPAGLGEFAFDEGAIGVDDRAVVFG